MNFANERTGGSYEERGAGPNGSQAVIEPGEARELRGLLADLAEQAAARRFLVAPNPCVGAAVLSNGVEIGRGFHDAWGGPHAEVLAIEAAAASGVPRESWDTLVCTLEPCSSDGKTPPCTDLVLSTNIRRVVVAALDPDPRHRGRGLELLHARGVEIVHLDGAAPLERVCPHFLRWTSAERLRRKRPWTLAKWAQTRTGQLTPPEHVGEGRWISGPAALRQVQELRANVDAVVTGVGTVLADDPRLTLRDPIAGSRAPLRVVLDSGLRTPPRARLLEAPGEGEHGGTVHLFTRPGNDRRWRELEARGATIHTVRPGDDGRPSLREVATRLWELGVRRMLLEAGPTLLEAWFESDLVDQLRVYTGDVNGGRGPTLAELLRPERLDGVAHGEVGTDAVLDAFVKR